MQLALNPEECASRAQTIEVMTPSSRLCLTLRIDIRIDNPSGLNVQAISVGTLSNQRLSLVQGARSLCERPLIASLFSHQSTKTDLKNHAFRELC